MVRQVVGVTAPRELGTVDPSHHLYIALMVCNDGAGVRDRQPQTSPAGTRERWPRRSISAGGASVGTP